MTNSFIDRNAIFKSDISDHFPIYSIIPSTKPKIEDKTSFIFKSIFNFDAINTFKQDLQKTNWKDIEAFTDPNESYNTFLERFLLLYDKHFPIRKIKIKVKDLVSPWITNGIKKSSKKKQAKKTYCTASNILDRIMFADDTNLFNIFFDCK